MKIFLLIILLCISHVALAQDEPEWIDTGADSPTEISAVGYGETKLDAVASALGELSRNVEYHIETTFTDGIALSMSYATSNTWFGKVNVQSVFIDSTQLSGGYGRD